jgi:hypothetical protein
MGLTPLDDRMPQILMKPFKNTGSTGRSPDFTILKESFYEYRRRDPITGLHELRGLCL